MALIGLGYVGLPLAVEFAKRINVIGFDCNENKIQNYRAGIDITREVGNNVIKETTVDFITDETRLSEAKFLIIAVPTPIKDDKTPDLFFLESSSRIVGRNLTPGSVVVYESTVYPGVTEDICIPILEKESGLKCGVDFKVGYSPERINPGDKVHRLPTIKKIVSGMDAVTVNIIAKIYELVITAGVYKSPSIKVAEAAKIVENSQRDINIAFMNELSIIFNKMGLDTKEVLEAAETKWNFIRFAPGLVGGQCVGAAPYYLTYIADTFGYHSQVMLAGRHVNDSMGKYVAENCVKKLIAANKDIKNAKVAILGITFKEDFPDVRNSKINDIVYELREYGIDPIVTDAVADSGEVEKAYGVKLVGLDAVKKMDAVILAVAHEEYTKLSLDDICAMFGEGQKIILDVKGVLNRKEYESAGYNYWRL